MNHNKLVASFKGLRATVIGDIMLDHYIWGDTRRISPEAPVPVIEVLRESHTAGGAANVALNLSSIGADVFLCGAYGSDSAGFKLANLLNQRRVMLSEDHASGARQTITKTRVLVQRQQLCRIDTEEAPANYSLDQPKPLAAVLAGVRSARAIILSDYAKGVLTPALVEAVLETARQSGAVVAWDPKPKNGIVPRGVTVMTPNRAEAQQLAGLSELRHGEPFPAKEVGRAIFERYQPRYLVVTLGAEGMMFFRGPDAGVHLPTMAREVFDVSGAGDTVVAVLAAGLAAGWDVAEAVVTANAAAGVVVGKIGTATVSTEELAVALAANGVDSYGSTRIPA